MIIKKSRFPRKKIYIYFLLGDISAGMECEKSVKGRKREMEVRREGKRTRKEEIGNKGGCG